MNDSKGNLLLYQTEDGQTKIEVTLANDAVWLTADQMAELFQRNKSTISRHIKNVFESGELKPDSTVAFFATVQNEGTRKVERNIAYYNLDMIISVGYRVNSHRGVQFRIWATQVLREYLIKGFAMNDDLLFARPKRYSIVKCWRFTRSASTMTHGQRLRRCSSKPYKTRCTSRLTDIRRQKLSTNGRMPTKTSWA